MEWLSSAPAWLSAFGFQSNAPLWIWMVLGLSVSTALFFDLASLRKGAENVSMRQATRWSIAWVVASLIFCFLYWISLATSSDANIVASAAGKTTEYLTGYAVEKSLSLDNLFVFALIFGMLGIQGDLQKKALVMGIVGAIVLRTVMVIAGGAALMSFHALFYFFGAFLLWTSWSMWRQATGSGGDSGGAIVEKLGKWLPTAPADGERLTVGRWRKPSWGLTPLGLSIVAIAIVDVAFAVDSIPAIYAITADPFIVLSSNLFAVMGLRPLYFLLAGAAEKFKYLQHGLAALLAYIGGKMILADWFKIDPLVSLFIVLFILGASIALSMLSDAKTRLAKEV